MLRIKNCSVTIAAADTELKWIPKEEHGKTIVVSAVPPLLVASAFAASSLPPSEDWADANALASDEVWMLEVCGVAVKTTQKKTLKS